MICDEYRFLNISKVGSRRERSRCVFPIVELVALYDVRDVDVQ